MANTVLGQGALWFFVPSCCHAPGHQGLVALRTGGFRQSSAPPTEEMAASAVLGFSCFRPALLPSYRGQPNIPSTGNFLLQDTLCTESPKSRRGLRKVSWRGDLGVSVGPSAWSWGKHRPPAPAATPNTRARGTLLSTALVKLSTHCL